MGSLKDLAASYDGARYAIRFRFFKGDNSIIDRKDVTEPQATQIDFDSYENTLIDALKACSQVRVISALHEFLNVLRAKNLKIERCVFYVHCMMISVVNLVNEIDFDGPSAFLNEALEQTNQMPSETLDEAGRCLENLCRKFLGYVAELKRTGVESIVLRSQQYIKEHYSDPELSLNTIAASFSVSVSYFCSIFKSHTGKTFLEYLNRFRMERAKELLKSTGKSICEIAEAVGYTDQHYFSIAFKKCMGITPKNYRAEG